MKIGQTRMKIGQRAMKIAGNAGSLRIRRNEGLRRHRYCCTSLTVSTRVLLVIDRMRDEKSDAMAAKQFIKNLSKKILYGLHRAALPFGFFLLPRHYYVPFADLRQLKRNKERWARPSRMAGVEFDLDRQAETLLQVVLPFRTEYERNESFLEAVRRNCGPGYGYIEAQALHGVIRYFKPGRIIEVGSGVSTFCMLEAAKVNGSSDGGGVELTCIQPYPSGWLKSAPVNLVSREVQDVSPETFDTLGPGDLLFIDSSHTVRLDGDVNYLYLEILPRLNPGVVVHIHDIYLPYDYQRDADRTMFQWMETALLHALLINNDRFEVLFCMSALHYAHRDELLEAFPSYRAQKNDQGLRVTEDDTFGPFETHFPSSIYLRVKSG